jgi:hypothetical protein
MAHVGTNRMQVLEGGVQANYFNALASKYPIVIAGDRASTPLGHLVMIRPDLKDEIKSLKDLKGRTLSLAGAGSIIAYEMDKLLQTVGLSLKDTNVKVLPVPQLPVAFANKVIDAADIYAPMTHQLEQQKLAVRLVDPDDVLTNMVVAVSIINTDWARDKPAAAQVFFTALLRGARDYCQAYHGGKNRQEVMDIIIKTGIEKRPEILALPWPSRRPTGRVDPAAIARLVSGQRFRQRRRTARPAGRQPVRGGGQQGAWAVRAGERGEQDPRLSVGGARPPLRPEPDLSSWAFNAIISSSGGCHAAAIERSETCAIESAQPGGRVGR